MRVDGLGVGDVGEVSGRARKYGDAADGLDSSRSKARYLEQDVVR